MAVFSCFFRADVVSSGFDLTIENQALSGRTDLVRAAIGTQYGLALPAKKAAFMAEATKITTVALEGDSLGLRSYKERAALCAALAVTVATLDGKNPSSGEELGRFMSHFAPKKKPATVADKATATVADKATATVAVAVAFNTVLNAIKSGTLSAAQFEALRSAINETATV